MRKLLRSAVGTIFLVAAGSLLAAGAQREKTHLPRVLSAAVPLYPSAALAARTQGIIRFQVSTDGKRVTTAEVDGGSPPPVLVQAATENIKTWEFESHEPTKFEATFHYWLLPYYCGPECKCENDEKVSVLLKLPTDVDLTAAIPMNCEPPANTNGGK